MNQEISYLCGSCGNNFSFSKKEQDFFKKKGFKPPKRCKDCIEKDKTNRGVDKKAKKNKKSSKKQHSFKPITCLKCGISFSPPNKPDGDKYIYCSDCYEAL